MKTILKNWITFCDKLVIIHIYEKPNQRILLQHMEKKHKHIKKTTMHIENLFGCQLTDNVIVMGNYINDRLQVYETKESPIGNLYWSIYVINPPQYLMSETELSGWISKNINSKRETATLIEFFKLLYDNQRINKDVIRYVLEYYIFFWNYRVENGVYGVIIFDGETDAHSLD